MVKLEYISTNLRRYTFQSPRIKKWVEGKCYGRTLNLFAGRTLLDINEVRNDKDITAPAEHHEDALDFIKLYNGEPFNTILLDPPYSYRKSMEMYNGNYSSRFKQIADTIPNILTPDGRVVSFGYHSSFMGKKRGYELEELCVFGHGGAQHCTIAIVEVLK